MWLSLLVGSSALIACALTLSASAIFYRKCLENPWPMLAAHVTDHRLSALLSSPVIAGFKGEDRTTSGITGGSGLAAGASMAGRI